MKFPCTAGCGAEVREKAKSCKQCGAEQVRAEQPQPVADSDDDAFGPRVHPPAPIAEVVRLVPVEKHVFLDDFRIQVGEVNCPFKRGDTVIDPAMIATLKIAKAPIVPLSEAENMACCPRCQMVFATGKGVEPPKRSAA